MTEIHDKDLISAAMAKGLPIFDGENELLEYVNKTGSDAIAYLGADYDSLVPSTYAFRSTGLDSGSNT